MSGIESTPFVVAADDDGRHDPDGHPEWQESCALIWFDPEQEIAGYQHLYLRPANGHAVLWGWHLDDTGVHASTDPVVAALPSDDLRDFEVLGWRIKTMEPLVSYDATATYGDTESQSRTARPPRRSRSAFRISTVESSNATTSPWVG